MWWKAVFQPVWTVSLLPNNATPWELAVEAVDADLVARDPIGLIPAGRRDDIAPLELLPYLAAERSVNEFSGAWPEAQQRAVVRESFALHQRLGTRKALDNALAPFGYSVKVVEWFEHQAWRPAYTFQIRVNLPDLEPWSAAQRVPLIRLANGAKNAHTKLEALHLRRKAPAGVFFIGGVPHRRRSIKVGQVPKPTTLNQTSHIFLGAFVRRYRKVAIRPQI